MEISDVLSYIAQADDGQLNEITSALTARYKVLFPDWEVAYLSLPPPGPGTPGTALGTGTQKPHIKNRSAFADLPFIY